MRLFFLQNSVTVGDYVSEAFSMGGGSIERLRFENGSILSVLHFFYGVFCPVKS